MVLLVDELPNNIVLNYLIIISRLKLVLPYDIDDDDSLNLPILHSYELIDVLNN